MQCAAQLQSIKSFAINQNESPGSLAHACEQRHRRSNWIRICGDALLDETGRSVQRSQSSARTVHAEVTYPLRADFDFRNRVDCAQSHFAEACKWLAQRTQKR